LLDDCQCSDQADAAIKDAIANETTRALFLAHAGSAGSSMKKEK
jgi:hypothetical protein